MAYAFFFSYAHENRTQDNVLDRFFTELSTEVAQRLGIREPESGFIDRENLRTGTVWSTALAEALQTSRVFVPIVSPHYLGSSFCGKEFQIFLERRERYVRANADANPAVIFPIIWIKAAAPPLPAAVSQFQYPHQVGVRSLMLSKDGDRYQALLQKLADDIAEASRLAPPLARLDTLASFDDVQNAFAAAPDGPSAGPIQSAGLAGTPSAARIVYVVAREDEIAAAPAPLKRSDIGAYGKSGYFWRPFRPGLDRVVGQLTFDSVSGYEYKSADFSPDLIDDLLRYDAAGEIVVLVVDPWTIRLPRYQQVMERFDERQPLKSGVVVPWNEEDGETAAAGAQLHANVRLTFKRLFPDDKRFRYRIRSAQDYNDAIKNLLAHLALNASEILAAQIALKGPPLATISPAAGQSSP
jgi:FxsC-like protein